MTLHALFGLITFAFVSSVTPGPNNLMLLSSGLTFGLRRTVPHMLGVTGGFILMVALLGLGLGAVFERIPGFHTGLRLFGMAYLLYLAWRIFNAGVIEEGEGRARPMTFLEAAAFQWVNPKAWIMALTAIAAYTNPDNYIPSVLMLAVMFGLVNFPSVGVWAGAGMLMRKLLHNPKAVRVVNITMAILLVLSLWPILAEMMR